jgi:hypothetical protein
MPRKGYVYCSCCDTFIPAKRERAHRTQINTPGQSAPAFKSMATVHQVVDVSSDESDSDSAMLVDVDEPSTSMNVVLDLTDDNPDLGSPQMPGTTVNEDINIENQNVNDTQILWRWYDERQRLWEERVDIDSESEEEKEEVRDEESDSDDEETYPNWDSFTDLPLRDQLGEGFEREAAGIGKCYTLLEAFEIVDTFLLYS